MCHWIYILLKQVGCLTLYPKGQTLRNTNQSVYKSLVVRIYHNLKMLSKILAKISSLLVAICDLIVAGEGSIYFPSLIAHKEVVESCSPHNLLGISRLATCVTWKGMFPCTRCPFLLGSGAHRLGRCCWIMEMSNCRLFYRWCTLWCFVLDGVDPHLLLELQKCIASHTWLVKRRRAVGCQEISHSLAITCVWPAQVVVVFTCMDQLRFLSIVTCSTW